MSVQRGQRGTKNSVTSLVNTGRTKSSQEGCNEERRCVVKARGVGGGVPGGGKGRGEADLCL